MSSCALEGRAAADLIRVAVDEFDQVAGQEEAAAVWLQNLQAAGDGTWRAGAAGVALDAGETLTAVVHVLAACGEDVEGRCGMRPAWAGHRHGRGDHRRHPGLRGSRAS